MPLDENSGAGQYVAVVGDTESQEKDTSPIAATPSTITDWAVVKKRPTVDPVSSLLMPSLLITVLITPLRKTTQAETVDEEDHV